MRSRTLAWILSSLTGAVFAYQGGKLVNHSHSTAAGQGGALGALKLTSISASGQVAAGGALSSGGAFTVNGTSSTFNGTTNTTGNATFGSSVTFNGGLFNVGFDSATALNSIAVPATGKTACNVCLGGSTLTVTGRNLPVEVTFTFPVGECNSSAQIKTGFLQNGAFVSPWNTDIAAGRDACGGTGQTANPSFSYKIPAPAAGTLNYCAIACSTLGDFDDAALAAPQFRVREIFQ